jgi:hypothetical protein
MAEPLQNNLGTSQPSLALRHSTCCLREHASTPERVIDLHLCTYSHLLLILYFTCVIDSLASRAIPISIHPVHSSHTINSANLKSINMCIMKSYETRGRTVVEPPPRRGNYTSHAPAGVMRLPREWRRSESYSDDGRYVEYRYVPLTRVPFLHKYQSR